MENNFLDYTVKDLVSKTGKKPDQLIALLTGKDPMTPEEILHIAKMEEILAQSPSPLTSEDITPERLKERELEKLAPSTGFPSLDYILKGFVPGRVYTLSGDTNIGKTSLSANFAYAVAKQGRKVLYLALEPGNSIIDYLACVATGKRFEDITEEDYTLVGKAGISFYKNDTINTPEQMVKALREQERYDLVIIDHIGYFTMAETGTTQRESNVVKAMAKIAQEKMCAIIQIRHLKKPDTIKKRLPNINDVMGSAAFKQDAQEVVIAYRDPDENDKFGIMYKNTGQIFVHKTKSGPNGHVPIQFFDANALIKELVVPLNPWKAPF